MSRGHCEACGGRGEIDVSPPYAVSPDYAECLTCDGSGLAPGYVRCRCGEGVYNPDEESACADCQAEARLEGIEAERERVAELRADAYRHDAYDRAGDR